MKLSSHSLFLTVARGIVLCAFASSICACALNRSKVPFRGSAGQRLSLSALSREAADGALSGGATAWFAFSPERALAAEGPAALGQVGGRGALEVAIRNEGSSPVTVSLGFVYATDLDSRGSLRRDLPARPLSVVSGLTGEARVRMLVPARGATDVRGFAVSLSGADGSRLTVVSASIEGSETGWELGDSLWAGFPAEGGTLDAAFPARASVSLSGESFLTARLRPSGSGIGTPQRQGRVSFSSGKRIFGFRKASGAGVAYLSSYLVPDPSAPIRLLAEGLPGSDVIGLRVTHGRALPTVDGANPASPVFADPRMVIEWPIAAWRRADYEIFAWDRFPSILVFDTADYAVQDRLFKRLAFFVEKQGYRGRLLPDAEIAPLHGYNAHDYRAESLASFFEAARKSGFPLNADELALRDVLVSEGIVRKDGSSFVAGAGAVLSFSRESASDLRYRFMAHEGFHGIYFVDPDFRAKVSSVFNSMDSRAIAFLKTYFTVVGGLGYDTSDAYLMENEFMAYLLQQGEDLVGPYFAESVMERYLRLGGDPKLGEYVKSTNAAEFTRAAHELNEYVFGRWGLAGGRVWLFFLD